MEEKNTQDGREDFLKSLQSQVIDKERALENYNKIVSENSKNI